MIGTNEKKAVTGISLVLIFFTLSVLYVGKKNFWFSSITKYNTVISNAEGLQIGADITISGFRVGKVLSLRVNKNNKITVVLGIYSKMAHKITNGTKAKVLSSNLLGQKKVSIIPSSTTKNALNENSFIPSSDTQNLAEMLSSENISDAIIRLDTLSTNIEKSLVSMGRLSSSINTKLLKTKLIQSTLRDTKAFIKPFKINQNEIKELINVSHSLAKDLENNPNMTKDISMALKETIITLKAIQKTWILENHVDKLKNNNK